VPRVTKGQLARKCEEPRLGYDSRVMTLTSLALASVAPAVVSATVQADEGLIWTCPVHREETSTVEGLCVQCGRPFVRARVTLVWSCPLHALAEAEPGKCRVCGRDLYPVSQEVSFVCPMHSEVREIEPGSCPICRMALVSSTSSRPHQDHNPKHGGIFFMAPDAWHHLEGTYPEDGYFRVHVYDNFSQPLSAKAFKGRVVLKETFDPVSRETKELLAYPLLPSRDGSHLEARVPSGSLPLELAAKIQFEKDGPFERFDFVFASLSTASATAAPSALVDLVVPEEPEAVAAAIVERDRRVKDLLARGAFNELYIPALEAKDLALALEAHLSSAADPASLGWALKELVRAAWLLDDYGDLGNREKLAIEYERFEEAIEWIASSYGVAR
jgi:Heavy metal binding domain